MKYLLLLLSFSAFADTATFTFTPPTEREDSTVLQPAEIGGYNVFVNGVKSDISPLLPVVEGFTLSLPSGEHTVEITTVDTDSREGEKSAPVKVLVFSDPKPAVINCELTADFNGDGIVNGLDVGAFKTHFGQQYDFIR